jgi:hypothetical protein
MNDAVLQVLLVLIYLPIGLISVTFPIYAISVNFLPKQKWEDEKERKKRMDGLKAKISQLTNELKGESQDAKRVTELKDKIDKYKNELESTKLRYQYLTAKGAVGVPVISLALGLLFAGVGIYAFYIDDERVTLLAGLSVICSAFTLYRLYMTISAVEYGALRPERTVQFEVTFGKKAKAVTMELNKEAWPFCFFRPEADIENLYAVVRFPSELGVTEDMNPYRSDPKIVLTEYEEYTLIRYVHDFLPKGSAVGFSITAVPKKKGKYPVAVRICAKGIYEYDENLTVEVV